MRCLTMLAVVFSHLTHGLSDDPHGLGMNVTSFATSGTHLTASTKQTRDNKSGVAHSR